MRIAVTPEQIGRAIGLAVLLGLATGLSGGIIAWVVWEPNPSEWSPAARAWHASLTLILLVLHWLYGVVDVEE